MRSRKPIKSYRNLKKVALLALIKCGFSKNLRQVRNIEGLKSFDSMKKVLKVILSGLIMYSTLPGKTEENP